MTNIETPKILVCFPSPARLMDIRKLLDLAKVTVVIIFLIQYTGI